MIERRAHFAASPAQLQGTLDPNLTPNNMGDVVNDAYLYVEFVFKTSAQNASPKLKNFSVGYKCFTPPG